MTTKAEVFNHALTALGHRRLVDTGEAVEAGRELVAHYDRVVDECLTAGPWEFAIETAALEADTGPVLGYTHVFQKPTDWVTTESLAFDTNFTNPLFAYYEDHDFYAADTGHINVRYVSDDTGKGYDLAAWRPAFARYVHLSLAERVCLRLTNNTELLQYLVSEKENALSVALDRDTFRPAWPNYTSTTNTKARIIHTVLLELGEMGKVVTQNEDLRRGLDRIYNNVVTECLLAGSWNFAMETVKLDADTGVTPGFGYTEVFAKPSDWLRTHAISTDEYFSTPLLAYYDDANFWSAGSTPIYVRYVSSDTGLGYELTRWPRSFTRYVEMELAVRIGEIAIPHLRPEYYTAEEGKQRRRDRTIQAARKVEILKEERDKARRLALNHDAMNESQPKFPPMGNWNRSRFGRIGQNDRGRRDRLIG